MKSASYLSSARVYSLVMLVAVYLDVDLASSSVNRVTLLQEARKAVAIDYLHEPANRPAGEHTANVADLGSVTVKPATSFDLSSPEFSVPGWSVGVRDPRGKTWSAFVKKSEADYVVAEAKPAGQTQRNSENTNTPTKPTQPVDDNRPDKASVQSSTPTPLKTLQRVAAVFGLNQSENKDVMTLFQGIEKEFVDRQITIPGLGLAFRNYVAPWVIALLTIAFLLVIRNQLKRVLIDAELAIDEPWIVLDSERGLERVVGGAWLLAILFAPWIASGCLLAVVAVVVVAEGGVTTALSASLLWATMLTLVVVGGWASLTVVADILRLRELRKQKLQSLLSADGATRLEG